MEANLWVKRKLLNFKKEEKDEKPFTVSCNLGKGFGNTATNEGICINCEIPSSPKKLSSQKLRKLL
jgi:hypothetical protein